MSNIFPAVSSSTMQKIIYNIDPNREANCKLLWVIFREFLPAWYRDPECTVSIIIKADGYGSKEYMYSKKLNEFTEDMLSIIGTDPEVFRLLHLENA
jgi:hypothetical protein